MVRYFDIREFIKESNAIEEVHTHQAIQDSLEAWEYLKNRSLKLGMDDVLLVHKLVLKNLRPDIAGKLRKLNVRVGDRLCPDWEFVKGSLAVLMTMLPKKTMLEVLRWHIDFEALHPFEDGNGRVGRLIMAHQSNKLNLHPILFRANDRSGYYSLFHGI